MDYENQRPEDTRPDELNLDEIEDSNPGIQFGDQAPRRRAAAAEAQRKVVTAMKEQQAVWQKDGLGIRGAVSTVSNAVANLVFANSGVTARRPELTTATPVIETSAEIPTEETNAPAI